MRARPMRSRRPRRYRRPTPACRHKRAAGGRPRPCGLWRPNRSPLGAHDHGGPLAARGATHVAIAVDGRRPAGAESRNDDLVLATAAVASVGGRTIDPPQSGIGRRRRGPALFPILRARRPAFAPVGFFRLIPIATAHAGVDIARTCARPEIGTVFVRVAATTFVACRAVLADNAALRRRRPGSARDIGADDRDRRKCRKSKAHHEPHVLSPPGAMTREYRTEAHRIVNVGGRVAPYYQPGRL